MLNPTGVNEVFCINGKTGAISSRGQLDRETLASYVLQVRASDMAAPSLRKQSENVVRINVLDENDNFPHFSNRSYAKRHRLEKQPSDYQYSCYRF